jgi:hypothetical protein
MQRNAVANGDADDGELVDKYTSCSLYPIFSHLVSRVTSSIEQPSD